MEGRADQPCDVRRHEHLHRPHVVQHADPSRPAPVHTEHSGATHEAIQAQGGSARCSPGQCAPCAIRTSSSATRLLGAAGAVGRPTRNIATGVPAPFAKEVTHGLVSSRSMAIEIGW